jgi:hypothetical protein
MRAWRDLLRRLAIVALLGAALPIAWPAAAQDGAIVVPARTTTIGELSETDLRDLALRQSAAIQDLERRAATVNGATPLAIGGFFAFVVIVAFGLGRYAWILRRDYMQMIATTPRDPNATEDRISILRDSPFGLPEGSVRAIISISIVLLTLPSMVLSRALGLTGTGELGTILGGVMGFYFGSRSAGGGDAEAARRQADLSLREAQSARQEKEAAVKTATEAQAAQQEAQAEAGRAQEVAVLATTSARVQARETGEAASRITELTARAAEGVAVARAIAALLPAGPAASAIAGATATAGAVLGEASRATAAVQAALQDPTGETVAAAVDAASAVLRSAGEGTEVAEKLRTALEVVREASTAIGAVRRAVDDPSPASVTAALAEAAILASRRMDGGLGGALAPALGMLGSAMKLPGLAGLLGAASPIGLAAGVLFGAWQAAKLGRQHYQRWMARVLDRPVSRDLFPGGEWDGQAAAELIREFPALATALADRVGEDAPQQAAADALRRLLDPGAAEWLWQSASGAFASEEEAAATVAALRRRVLETELDRVDSQPVAVGGGLAISQARLREDLDRLRESGAGGAIDTLVLLADGVINARPDVPGAPAGTTATLDVPALLQRGLEDAARQGKALERAPPPAAPPVEGEG